MRKINDINLVILFGSRAVGTASEKSDYDIGILLKNPGLIYDRTARTELYDAIYDLLSVRVGAPVNIDIVFLHQAPLDLQSHVMKHGQLLYEYQQGTFANYREQVMENVSDFAPHRSLFEHSIIARINV